MIPMILIVGTVDVFYHFVQCPLHLEWSAPCTVNWFLAVIYGIFLLMSIIFSVISARMLRNIKKQIENDFFSSIKPKDRTDNIGLNKKVSNKKYRKNKRIVEMIEENKHEDDDFKKWVKSKTNKTKNMSLKNKIARQ